MRFHLLLSGLLTSLFIIIYFVLCFHYIFMGNKDTHTLAKFTNNKVVVVVYLFAVTTVTKSKSRWFLVVLNKSF